jgi:hypothetical protein
MRRSLHTARVKEAYSHPQRGRRSRCENSELASARNSVYCVSGGLAVRPKLKSGAVTESTYRHARQSVRSERSRSAIRQRWGAIKSSLAGLTGHLCRASEDADVLSQTTILPFLRAGGNARSEGPTRRDQKPQRSNSLFYNSTAVITISYSWAVPPKTAVSIRSNQYCVPSVNPDMM